MAGTPSIDLTPLSIDFNDKTPGESLGEGGVALGEPINLSSLDTLIIESSPGENFLVVANDLTDFAARSLRWEFEDEAEFAEGLISISLDFTPSVRDSYAMYVLENAGSSKDFLRLNFNDDGVLFANDSAGFIGQYFIDYDGGDTIHIEILFDMDARTSSLLINGTSLFSARAHGVSDRGVGAIRTGYAPSSNGSAFALDNLLVLSNVALPLVLDADFEDKKPGQPIGEGGAELGEPVEFSPLLAQAAVSLSASNIGLQLVNTSPDFAQFAHWEFLKDIQIRSGIVAFEMDVRFSKYEQHMIRVHEKSGSTYLFGGVYFLPDPTNNSRGLVVIADEGGSAGAVGSFDINVFYRLQMIFDMDQGTYTVKLADRVLVEDRPHEVAEGIGIGSLHTGFAERGQISAPMQIDNLQVGSSDARSIPSALTFLQEPTEGSVDQPLSPAIEVAVDNVFGELVPDGRLVSLVIDSGPAGAQLNGAMEPVVAGVARFDSLSANLPGTYRLRAISGDVEQLGSLSIVVLESQDRIFNDGFDGNPTLPH
ncbi:hypothetical protein [Dokdonella sp.]|uniref:hypothetical protein n=1 Tax=Dokdonella sp. TaxID=2291710 RepID=UPI003C5AB262